MKNSDAPLPASSYIGHVKDGVVVFDAPVSLQDGQAVRVESLGNAPEAQLNTERAAQVARLQQLFAHWTEEDGKLSDEEADRLHTALEHSPRLRFGSLDLR